MRVVFLNPQGNFDPEDSYWTEHPDIGGQLVYVKELASAMAQLGVDVDIITRRIIDPDWPEFSDEKEGYRGIENLRILRFACGGDKFLKKEDLWPYLEEWCNNIKAFYESENEIPDFMTGHYGDGGISAAILSQKLERPFSFTAHSLGALKMDKLGVNEKNMPDYEKVFHFSRRLAAERIAMHYSSVNFVSTKMERFEQYGHPRYKGWIDVHDDSHFKVVPPGVNRRIFNEVDEKSDEAFTVKIQNHNKPFVVLSSRIDPKKNHISVIKAFGEDEELRNMARLLIVVRGLSDVYEDIDKLKENEKKIVKQWLKYIEENGLRDNISFINAENQKELAALYRYAKKQKSVFCNPALYEPFGLTVIEAMSCGLPVAATENGGPSEILEEDGKHYGFLFDPEKTASISEKLKEALSNETDYKRLADLSIRRVLEKYTWEKSAESYLDEIKKKIATYQPVKIDLSPFRDSL